MSVQVQIETRQNFRAYYSSRSELYLHNIIYTYIHSPLPEHVFKAQIQINTRPAYIIIINTDLGTARTSPRARVFRTRKYLPTFGRG